MQKNDGRKFHGVFILPLGWMLRIAGEEIQGVRKEGKDGTEGAFGSAGAAGKVENEGVSDDSADATT
jgi:hypothetical protein